MSFLVPWVTMVACSSLFIRYPVHKLQWPRGGGQSCCSCRLYLATADDLTYKLDCCWPFIRGPFPTVGNCWRLTSPWLPFDGDADPFPCWALSACRPADALCRLLSRTLRHKPRMNESDDISYLCVLSWGAHCWGIRQGECSTVVLE